MFKTTRLCMAIALALIAWPGWAAPTTVQLQFEGLTVEDKGLDPQTGLRQPVYVAQYYSGGQVRATYDKPGSWNAGDFVPSDVAGDDFGILINGDPVNDPTIRGYESRANGGTGNFTSPAALHLGTGALGVGIESAGEARLLVQPGVSFNNGFSFWYSALGGSQLSVLVLDGAGAVLFADTLAGQASCAGDYAFCNWTSVASLADLSLAGIAQIVFQGIGFVDNITIGSNDPTTRTPQPPSVPEPATYALMVFGLGAVALTARRRQRKD